MADRLLIGHSTAAASAMWNDDDESLHILTLLGMRGRNDQHRMGKFNISRARFRGEGNSSLVLAFEDHPYVIKLKKVPISDVEHRDSGESFDRAGVAGLSRSTRNLLSLNCIESSSNCRIGSDQVSADDYWLSMHKYQISFIKNVAVPLLGGSLVDVPALIKISRSELAALLAESRKDRAAHRLMKAPSPQLGCGLIFPDCCIFKSSFRAVDPEQARSVISGFQKTRNLDKACYDAGHVITDGMAIPVLGPVISIEIKAKMGFLPLPIKSDAACTVPLDVMTRHYPNTKESSEISSASSCYNSSNSPPGVSHPLKAHSPYDLCPSSASHCQTSASLQLEKTRLRSRLCRFHMVQHHKLRQGRIQHISNYCPLDLFSGCPERMKSAILELLHNPQNNLRLFRNRRLIFGGEHQKLGHDPFGIIRLFENMLFDFLPGHKPHVNSGTKLSCNDQHTDTMLTTHAITGSTRRSDAFTTENTFYSNDHPSTTDKNLQQLEHQSVMERALSNGCDVSENSGDTLSAQNQSCHDKHPVETTQCCQLTHGDVDKNVDESKGIDSEPTVSKKSAQYESSVSHLCNLIRLALCFPLQEDRCQEILSGSVRLETRYCKYSTKCSCYDVTYNYPETRFFKKSASCEKNKMCEASIHGDKKPLLRHDIPHGSVLYRVLQAQQLCSADVSTVHKAFYEDHRPEDFVEGRFPWPAIPCNPECLTNNERTPHETMSQFASRILWKHLVALTARDCSLMLTMQKIDISRWTGNISDSRLNILDYGDERYLLQIGIVDLEPKALDRIPEHMHDDLAMAMNFSLATT
ncbi:uncharacterized protein LOC111249289 isoform X2 [Varroa destructor]|uniref:inositol-pentakisphosphate 2-kinase n=1 Tax=Varroa destructor TaxID=109461 RepID=A0A7M7JY91_VARDE|nr:uncharacterized protein LOC111249289 isoform X2 [Varroa destructor]